MGLLTQSYRHDLLDVANDYRQCTLCRLHGNRKRTFSSIGNPDAAVVFVLDRTFNDEVFNNRFLVGGQYEAILTGVLEHLGKSIEDYWYTPVVLCPTVASCDLRPREQDVTPAPKAKEIKACSARLFREIKCIDPEIVVACGTQAIRAFFPTEPPSVHYNLGEVREAQIPGEYESYPMPVMVASSLQTLLAQQDMGQGGTWHTACQHIATAIEIAEFLRKPWEK